MEKIALGIKGMTCDHCVMTVTNALKAVPGVRSATVSLANNEAKVTYDGTVTTEESLKEAIREAGYQVG
ncbi:MAG: cation transporter [Firmicutes bacterium]|jgi:copper chaperone|nr:cation transporter [Bacillota bacterium]